MPAGFSRYADNEPLLFEGAQQQTAQLFSDFDWFVLGTGLAFNLPLSYSLCFRIPLYAALLVGIFQTTRMFPCIMICAMGNAIIAKPRKSWKSFAGSLISCAEALILYFESHRFQTIALQRYELFFNPANRKNRCTLSILTYCQRLQKIAKHCNTFEPKTLTVTVKI